MHDMEHVTKVKKYKYERIIKKCMGIMDKKQGATLDPVKKQVYNTAKARHDNVIKMRDKLVSKMLSTLKSFMHKSIRPNFIFDEIIQQKLGVDSWVNLQGAKM
jgi:hypothetical protein